MFFFASISGRNILRLSASFCLARARILCSSSLCRSCNLNRFLEGWEVEVVERRSTKHSGHCKKKGKKGSKTEHAKATQIRLEEIPYCSRPLFWQRIFHSFSFFHLHFPYPYSQDILQKRQFH